MYSSTMSQGSPSLFSTPDAPDSRVASATPTYEAALSELEELVARLESGQLPLDALLVQYQRGAELLTVCRNKLQALEQQVQVLDDGALKNWTAE
jgi:exodeoxyribonuclease VII small subunit